MINYHNRLTWFGNDIEDFNRVVEMWSFDLSILSCEGLFNNVFILIEELSFFFVGNGFDTGDVGGNEENFLRSTAIGGNSTPKKVFVGNCSLLAFVVIVQRSCIFFSRRDILSFDFTVIDSLDSIDEDDDTTCSLSLVNPIQMLLLFVGVSFASIMTLVVFEVCSIDDDDPST